ncbi:two-component system sensor histidine kinase NtrB [Roseisolibacter agri]|uniref:histidine kinase n=1 Tax=Roseisolibacter agri TaxID=2014610 RepID=A0AA37QFG0_9BACT|nr:ATP-binding protein [Roseisolibacter agri]GLC27891.1 PAS domain-containing sensor histidine kinase [Roseisolibacter agri]
MRQTPKSTDLTRQVTLEPRAVLRWAHAGRLVVVTALFLAAVFVWERAARDDTRIVAVAFALAAAWTAAAWWRVEVLRRRPGTPLMAAQSAIDLVLTTAVVHVTGGASSQFTPVYILVIAVAALLLPVGGGLATAVVAAALYGADVVWLRPGGTTLGLSLQACVFAIVALGAGYVGARLRQAGVGGERLAAALARARVEATDILRNIRSGIVTVDAQGRLLFANPAASALLQLDLASRLGRPVLDDIGRVAPVLADVLFRAAARGERTTRAEGDIRAGEFTALIGVTTTVSDGSTAAGVAGAPQASGTGTAIFSDITQSKRVEALHLRAQRLEAVAELSASLAHEIKNPLASIRSAVEQLARLSTRGIEGTLDQEDADDVRTLSGLTVRESDRLSRLLSEFLDFARARVTRVERVDAGAVAREAGRLAAAHPAAEHVRVHVAVPDDTPAIDGDPELLHRALFNLALNAVQATAAAHPQGGGRVRLEVQAPDPEELPGGLSFPDGAVALHVSDDGGGIAPELLDRLFDPFFTTRRDGSGLGLAVVQRAVESHRGVVLVEGGGDGTGARFTILLPRATAHAEPTLGDSRPYMPTPAVAHRAVA